MEPGTPFWFVHKLVVEVGIGYSSDQRVELHNVKMCVRVFVCVCVRVRVRVCVCVCVCLKVIQSKSTTYLREALLSVFPSKRKLVLKKSKMSFENIH